MSNSVRTIAIYLPQFHPIPENDKWWGKGFTEWTNVKNAKPLFKNHYQPHIPSDLGYYDLRSNEVFYQQIKLAKQYGIYGFMFYEYWFEGKRLLETPIENYLKDNKIDFPYFLCWANENWTRRWDGQDQEVLLKQTYEDEDFRNHFNKVYARHIISEKYIKINGKPVIAIYKPELIPNLQHMLQLWRNMAKEIGFNDLYVINCEASSTKLAPNDNGFDASYEFQPNWSYIHQHKVSVSLAEKLIQKIPVIKVRNILKSLLKVNQKNNTFINYKTYSEDIKNNELKAYKRFPCIMPSWDNTARRKNGNAVVFINSSPELYLTWFKTLLNKFIPYSEEENFVFINAWNEWAEGAHLEPCSKWGHDYLNATKEAINKKIDLY